jgi:hypothetical protein
MPADPAKPHPKPLTFQRRTHDQQLAKPDLDLKSLSPNKKMSCLSQQRDKPQLVRVSPLSTVYDVTGGLRSERRMINVPVPAQERYFQGNNTWPGQQQV